MRCASRRKQNTGIPSCKLALCPRKWGVSGGVSNSFRPCEMKDLFRMAQLDIYNVKQISFHSGRNPEFGMSKNRALYQTNEPNACAQWVWPWKIGRTNLTGRVCAAAMLLQEHSTHEEIRESVKVNSWVGSHNPAQKSSGSMIELWTSDGFEWFVVVNFSVPKFAVLARSKQLILMPVTVKFRSEFLVLWSPRPFVVVSFDVGPMFPCKASKQWRIVEIQLLASVGWKWGYQAFSCPRPLNVTHCRKEICSTSLSKGIQFLPEDWGRWEPQHAPSALHDGCIMLAKDRVEVSKMWITGHWLWSRLSYIPDCWKSMKNCRDSAFSLRGLEAGLWALSAADVRNMWRHVCLRNPFSPFFSGIPSIHSPESRSTLHQLHIFASFPNSL